ncbi:MAG TPA: hypothetical protein DHN29_06055 [Cytophagales bacterium]|nr:hypothetical protein [Cytophagales bacterium]
MALRDFHFLDKNFDFIHKFGRNGSIDTTSDPEDLWIAGAVYSWPTAAAVTTIVSSDTDDDGDPVGDGARAVKVIGLEV